jgi:hypothetical protein
MVSKASHLMGSRKEREREKKKGKDQGPNIPFKATPPMT